jgi:nucleotide-binding universal stress UspA family protein
MFNVIVVGTDGSGSATNAVRSAISLAGPLQAKLVIVSAYADGSQRPAETEGAPADIPVGPGVDAVAVVDAAAEVAEAAGVAVEREALVGDPADVLLSVAEQRGADLIVVGNKGMTGVQRFLLGSVPNKISHHSPCSVLIVHTT